MLNIFRFLAIAVLTSLTFFTPVASAQVAQTLTVEITGFKFRSEITNLQVGDTVIFVNKDVVPHTATQSNASWDSGSLATGESWSIKADMAGTFGYYCKFHPSMKAQIVVK